MYTSKSSKKLTSHINTPQKDISPSQQCSSSHKQSSHKKSSHSQNRNQQSSCRKVTSTTEEIAEKIRKKPSEQLRVPSISQITLKQSPLKQSSFGPNPESLFPTKAAIQNQHFQKHYNQQIKNSKSEIENRRTRKHLRFKAEHKASVQDFTLKNVNQEYQLGCKNHKKKKHYIDCNHQISLNRSPSQTKNMTNLIKFGFVDQRKPREASVPANKQKYELKNQLKQLKQWLSFSSKEQQLIQKQIEFLKMINLSRRKGQENLIQFHKSLLREKDRQVSLNKFQKYYMYSYCSNPSKLKSTEKLKSYSHLNRFHYRLDSPKKLRDMLYYHDDYFPNERTLMKSLQEGTEKAKNHGQNKVSFQKNKKSRKQQFSAYRQKYQGEGFRNNNNPNPSKNLSKKSSNISIKETPIYNSPNSSNTFAVNQIEESSDNISPTTLEEKSSLAGKPYYLTKPFNISGTNSERKEGKGQFVPLPKTQKYSNSENNSNSFQLQNGSKKEIEKKKQQRHPIWPDHSYQNHSCSEYLIVQSPSHYNESSKTQSIALNQANQQNLLESDSYSDAANIYPLDKEPLVDHFNSLILRAAQENSPERKRKLREEIFHTSKKIRQVELQKMGNTR